MPGNQRKRRKTRRELREEREFLKARRRMLDGLRSSPELAGTDLVVRNRSEEKVSAMLLKLAEPLMGSIAPEDLTPAKAAIGMAVLAWNLSLNTKDQQEVMFQEALRQVPESHPMRLPIARQIIVSLVRRKKELFPNVRCLIMRHELVPAPEGRRLTVVSSPWNDEPTKENP